MIYLLYTIPLIVWIIIARIIWGDRFSIAEMVIQAVPTILIISGMFFASTASQTSDTMLVNGVITGKEVKRQNCPNGWVDYSDSFCSNYSTRQKYTHTTCSTSNGKKSCTRHYKTQYKYDYDWEQRYYASSTLGTYQINRIDRRGVEEPPRYIEISKEDPVTASKSFTNYIRVESLHNQKYENVPPIAYPSIRDLYKANRVIFYKTKADSELYKLWNSELAKLNAKLKDTNVIIFITGGTAVEAEMLAQAWDAHNINDIVISIGINNEKIDWVDVRSWSSNDLVNVTIRDEILNLSNVDIYAINNIIDIAVNSYYEPRKMEEFEYLAEQIKPAIWIQILAALILIVISPAITFFFIRHDVNI